MKKLFSYQLSVTSKQVLLFTFHCLLFTVYCLLFTACDYVSNPLLPKSGGVINATNAIKASDSTGTLTNFLVEDYTGEYCENCPSAASALDNLIASHGNRITPLSVNYGYYATVSGLPNPYKNYNYTSLTGDTYGDKFVTVNGAFPSGFINRVGALATTSSPYPSWDGIVTNAITDSSVIKLKLSTQFDTLKRNLSVTVNTTFLKALSGSYRLVVLLTEDSMKGYQNVAGTQTFPYYHRFVLHDAINSTWGDSLVSNGAAANQTFTKVCPYTIDAYYPNSSSQLAGANTSTLTCNYKQCSVVAFVYDSKTSSPTQYVVLQSLALKIYNK